MFITREMAAVAAKEAADFMAGTPPGVFREVHARHYGVGPLAYPPVSEPAAYHCLTSSSRSHFGGDRVPEAGWEATFRRSFDRHLDTFADEEFDYVLCLVEPADQRVGATEAELRSCNPAVAACESRSRGECDLARSA